MVGRKHQTEALHEALVLEKSSFIALTGRRRVGKTFLVSKVLGRNFCLKVTGIQAGDTKTQINNFAQKLAEYSNTQIVTPPQNWQQLFILTKQYLQKLPKTKKQVIFLDELPWMNTPKAGFIQLLAHLWNDYLANEPHFILVICGSSTSWITNKIINDKGGFHNRITQSLHLQPFNLAETKEFLQSKNIKLTNSAIAEIYMAMGGIPFYLENIRRGESVNAAIERMCFEPTGILKYEYDNLFKSLFEFPENHEAIVAVLANSKKGLSREEIIKEAKISQGGPYTRAMTDLILSGFVVEETLYGKKKRGALYRLVDEYSVFYHRFIRANKKYSAGLWQNLAATQAYKIWKGFAFESLCIRHAAEIKKAIGIQNVYTEISSFRRNGTPNEPGFQVDLIIDRKDQTINLCECKFYEANFEVNSTYAGALKNRRALFISETKTKKIVFNTLITNELIKENEYSLEVIDSKITLGDLM